MFRGKKMIVTIFIPKSQKKIVNTKRKIYVQYLPLRKIALLNRLKRKVWKLFEQSPGDIQNVFLKWYKPDKLSTARIRYKTHELA